MTLNTSALYGTMAGFGIIQAVVAYCMFAFLNKYIKSKELLLACFLVATFCLQMLGHLTMQMTSCGGLRNNINIAKGAAVGTAITLGMVAIPLYYEPMRLVVSSILGDHLPMTTAEQQIALNHIVAASVGTCPVAQLKSGSGSGSVPVSVPVLKGGALSSLSPQKGGDSLTAEVVALPQKQPNCGDLLENAAYLLQTAQEIARGASYWSAFAGAYGIGVGSLWSATC